MKIELAVISFQLKTMLLPYKYKLHKSIPTNEHESQGNILKEDRSLCNHYRNSFCPHRKAYFHVTAITT